MKYSAAYDEGSQALPAGIAPATCATNWRASSANQSILYDPEMVELHGRILTPRLTLQLAAPANAAGLAALMHAEAESMLGSWAYPLSPAAAEEKIERAIVQANRHEALAYVFSDRVTGHVAGWCSAVRWHEAQDDIAMLTYWIGKQFEGRGLVGETIRAAGPHILAWIGASRLGAGAYPYNERSSRTMQRAGLTTPDGVRQLWSSTRDRNEPIICFAASREEVMNWTSGTGKFRPARRQSFQTSTPMPHE